MTVLTGKGIDFAQLCAFRAAVKLEAIGMKHSSGLSMTARAKKFYNIKGNRQAVIKQLTDKINTMMEEAKNETATAQD